LINEYCSNSAMEYVFIITLLKVYESDVYVGC
jgi:hypothetical protein